MRSQMPEEMITRLESKEGRDWHRVEARDLLFIGSALRLQHLFLLLLLASLPLSLSISLSKAVWVANRDHPLSSPTGILNISNSNVDLLDGNVVLWRKNLINRDSSVVAELLDNGNFVVKDPTGVLWQSFDSPTDTLLPGMILNANLVSWASSEDPSSGAYTYEIIGQQGFIHDAHQVPMTRIFPNKILPSTTNKTFSTMLRIDEYGVLQLLVWRDKWHVDWISHVDECDWYGTCGLNMFCDINLNPICNCIKGFEPSDKPYRGCERKKTQVSCVEKEFWRMTNMKLPDFGEQIDTKMGVEDCKERCVKDCNCVAFANMDSQNGGSGCMVWLHELHDIRSYKTKGLDFYIKLPVAADLVEGNNVSETTIGLIVGVSTLLLIFIVLLIYKTRKMRERTIVCQRENPTMDISITEDWQSHLMDFEVISQATNFFSDSNKIGEGGFGSVYKGRLLNGVEIAVKRLISMTPNGIENFDNEVRLIGLVQHINIIRLIGFFSDENEKILVYEHLENLGLDSYIFDTTRSSSLNWQKRFDIIIGIARGLLYLHQDSRFKIIHLDLKPSNILLGKDMIPKISDFGMAKTLARDETEAIATTAAGTFGYMPLEYLRDKIYSVKSDVFSFGVLLLEILSGKRNNRFPALNDGESLLSYVSLKQSNSTFVSKIETLATGNPSMLLKF
ncbi:Protein kinase-like domain superfamily [Arabidopsis thaliana x Arabidopsis arenosa]|uniref:non-specific serine/threonine protein kinase n=1 Tax=Arabidopsis thaliana x Arabidopsis arenosa TaxID=1240361 RepID=A0A8T2BC90_9BRAS|nr:Protein kinase-like domain superfamily [Arabidopsis thaliana x Arabidopsis arenosa]